MIPLYAQAELAAPLKKAVNVTTTLFAAETIRETMGMADFRQLSKVSVCRSGTTSAQRLDNRN
jgi:hypothetical protein